MQFNKKGIKMKLKCRFRFHDFLEIEDLPVYDKSNPYASMGQLEVCYARQCKRCAKFQVKSHGFNSKGWKDIDGFITNKKETITQNDDVAKIVAIVKVGTPIVSNL